VLQQILLQLQLCVLTAPELADLEPILQKKI
jgi:hypothetical protein